jgi:hypothetical protein
MKARKLRQLLNNTGYIISNNEKYIAVGSPLCHDLIRVDKETLKIKYAIDPFYEGRKCLEGKTNSKGENELLFIWDKLQELIASGEIKDIINGKDVIENPLPVFTVDNGVLVESVTDKYGWPNTDDNGVCMYENTHFKTKKQAIEYGISEYEAGASNISHRIEDIESDLAKAKERLDTYNKRVVYLKELFKSI